MSSSSKPTVATLKAEIDELRQLVQSLNTEISGLKMTLLNESSSSSTTTAAPAKVVKEKKAKKERDLNAPKKPLTSYMLFAKEERPKVVESNPEMKFTEIGREIGIRWKALSAEQQAKYKENKVEENKE